MPVKQYKPTSPARRGMSGLTFEEITRKGAERSLVKTLPGTGGRNNYGRTTARFHGGGHKRLYRMIDFKRDKWDVEAKVASIEYDPNRSANIALIHYKDGEKRYILAPVGLKVGDTVSAGEDVDIKAGNALPLRAIPAGTDIHNIELRKGKGGQIVRTAGGVAQLAAKEADYAHIKLPSGEVRLVHIDCMATVGQVGNIEYGNINLGKAGRSRWLGRRPHNRGVAMNPVDHPLGGGEGKSSGGRHPCSPWGQPAKGYRTRRNKQTNKFIVKKRYA
ncbi:MAG: 50S ribosomal protein L2 [bacterium]|nr:50S ribosomal protein L2 [bacterium]